MNLTSNADGGVDATANVGGVGRDPRALPPGSLTITPTARTAADTAGSVAVVANGLAFASDGSLFIADSARGAIWKVIFDAQGAVTSPMGCDTTFAPNTLCLQDVFVGHPILEGVDGIALDSAGNIWGAVNERNAIAVITPQGTVREVFPKPSSRDDQAPQRRSFGIPDEPLSGWHQALRHAVGHQPARQCAQRSRRGRSWDRGTDPGKALVSRPSHAERRIGFAAALTGRRGATAARNSPSG